jgi:hypothetical protein
MRGATVDKDDDMSNIMKVLAHPFDFGEQHSSYQKIEKFSGNETALTMNNRHSLEDKS